jgi:hypothetical protein
MGNVDHMDLTKKGPARSHVTMRQPSSFRCHQVRQGKAVAADKVAAGKVAAGKVAAGKVAAGKVAADKSDP